MRSCVMFAFALCMLAFPVGAQQTSYFKNIVILMDASGSMTEQRLEDGQLNWTMSKKHSAALLNGLVSDTKTPFSVVHFGADQPRFGVCTEGVGQPMGPADERRAKEAIQTISSWDPNGKTSLADGIKLAWAQLEDTGGAIIVFTDFEEDNCGGDPCATVERLFRTRDPGKPPINIRYVIPIGIAGFRTSDAFANCSGAETLPALKDEDIPKNVEKILDSLRPPKEARLKVSMTVSDPTGLGVTLPRQSVATVRSGGSNETISRPSAEVVVRGDVSRVEVVLTRSEDFVSGDVATPKGTTARVQTFFTPPLVLLSLDRNLGTADTKWSVTNAQTGEQFLFAGPQVEQFLPAGDYDVEVWEGEIHLTYAFSAEWNSISEHQIAP